VTPTYDHIYRLCRHPLLCAARAASDHQLTLYRCALPIEKRIVPKVCQLVQDINGHRICLGNWASCQRRALDAVLPLQDSQVPSALHYWSFPRVWWSATLLSGKYGEKPRTHERWRIKLTLRHVPRQLFRSSPISALASILVSLW